MTEPKKLLGFLQDGLVFQNRDDVDERHEYYEIYDNGTLIVVQPLPGASFGSKLGNEALKLATGVAAGPLGRIPGLFGGAFDNNKDQSFTNDPRKGRDTQGVPLLSLRNVAAKLQDFMKSEYGYNPKNYDLSTTWVKFAEIRDIEQSRNAGESFDDAFGRVTLLDPRDRTNATTFSGKEWLEIIRAEGTGDGEDGAGTESERGTSAADAARKEDKAAGLGTELGVGTGIGANTLEPGGVNGEITGDMLQDFVNSDFGFAFNAAINELRDAKTAGVFLSWMQDNFTRIKGMFLGEVGQQALAGEVPKGSFADFLRRQGVLSGEVEDATSPVFQSFVDKQSAGAGAGGGSSGGAVGPTPEGAGAGAGATVNPSAGQGPGLTDPDEEPLPEAVAAVLGITRTV